jgi:ATP-dependent Lon protease
MDAIQILKDYMASGSFARGRDMINADASIVYIGNINDSVESLLKVTHLFNPFPPEFNNDSAFFDRIHYYLPGWETPKLRSNLFTTGYGLISDCFAEFCHAMRKYDFTNSYSEYFELNRDFNTRDTIAVGRTFSGLAKLIYPHEEMTKEETREILEYAIECRRRVKEQLRKMTPGEFSDVNLGYIDLDSGSEHIVYLPEVSAGTLVSEGFEVPGHVYGVGRSVNDTIGIYHLENKLVDGTGVFSFKNVEGLARAPGSVKDSITAAFNYFGENAHRLVATSYEDYDYSLYFHDLQNRGVCDEISVAEVVGLFSGLANRAVLPSLVICGRVVMSGSMMPITTELEDIFVAAANAGARRIMLPDECQEKYDKLRPDLKEEISAIFYSTPLEAARIALGVG